LNRPDLIVSDMMNYLQDWQAVCAVEVLG